MDKKKSKKFAVNRFMWQTGDIELIPKTSKPQNKKPTKTNANRN